MSVTFRLLLPLLFALAAFATACGDGDDADEREGTTGIGNGTTPVVTSTPGDAALPPDVLAEQDDSPDLPGEFFPSQGRSHTGTYRTGADPIPFCDGVEWSGADGAAASLHDSRFVGAGAAGIPTDCYASNPPSSGPHLGVSRGVEVDGYVINIPPDPDVYPHDLKIPRDSIPHILEHAGVYVGWNCAQGDDACMQVVADLEALVNVRIDNHDNRVVMAWDSDIPEGQIGIASWTRVDRFHYAEYDTERAERFISTHSCRFDPERFCP